MVTCKRFLFFLTNATLHTLITLELGPLELLLEEVEHCQGRGAYFGNLTHAKGLWMPSDPVNCESASMTQVVQILCKCKMTPDYMVVVHGLEHVSSLEGVVCQLEPPAVIGHCVGPPHGHMDNL